MWTAVAWIIGAVAAVAAWMAMSRRARDRRRARAFAQPFPPEWAEVLRRNVPAYSRMPEDLRRELEGHVNVFVEEKNFEGCGGLEMTDEIRVTVAAHACMLLLGRPARYYPRLSSILVYPSGYVRKSWRPMGSTWVEGQTPLLGESWSNTAVVLSWDDVLHEADTLGPGHNLALHEFAHQIDQEDDGRADGVPFLGSRTGLTAWAQVVGREYDSLRLAALLDRESPLDKYGATHPAEFFAVATEAFFEKSRELKASKPELYEQLKAFYCVDPAEWQ